MIEGCGANGCEYMTGGTVVILGPAGDNFAAGMSGGMAFVLETGDDFPTRVNHESVIVRRIGSRHWEEIAHDLIAEHARETSSKLAQGLLTEWYLTLAQLWQVVPREMIARLPHPLDDEPGHATDAVAAE